ncbi:hypothetical protein DICSQDRAFT_99988 [Dichomitus squalens LYAD-421 SS1]|uniref:uncharacterized protein n=1 Tax=Dichomitus squalens (strain LYAD-421) TaxID=732165 RepID=UPI000441418C|nr:uncharacterized protein DICSQDRAFT_99988 [Dichomitus squalens LYAD-421 SS1]EJF64698.1 hypothetical protein DICSQDRAFT_99988 [Dichomitus squalens LYAD-421 SS1]
MANPADFGPLPPRFAELKKEIVGSYPDFEARATKAWGEILVELDKATKDIAAQGSANVPEVNFSELGSLTPERKEEIRGKGCLVIRDVVDDQEAREWQAWLRSYVAENPVDGVPEHDKQFFQLYWTKSQVRARSHPNILSATVWLNKLYRIRNGDGAKINDVDLETPLTYADRFRIRKPGVQWDVHPPHVDGGGIERWEDEAFRHCFDDILSGNWREHDPYDLENRVRARSSLYGRPNQATVFRTYQGWLALSETAPNEGTLQVFPNVRLSNAYIILRPFFALKDGANPDSSDPDDWRFDSTTPDFHGIYSYGASFVGPRPNTQTHPHLRLEQTMVPVPKVYPGDMVFWHSDVIHAVEKHHTGKEDSTVMYIPAMPYTAVNAAYIEKQKESFLQGVAPPDFPRNKGEAECVGVGKADDIENPIGKRAMGFAIEVA